MDCSNSTPNQYPDHKKPHTQNYKYLLHIIVIICDFILIIREFQLINVRDILIIPLYHVRDILIIPLSQYFCIDLPGAKSVLPKKRTIPCFWPATNTRSPTSTLTPSGSKLTPGKDFFLGAGANANQIWNSDDKLQIYTSLLCTPRLLIFYQKCSTKLIYIQIYFNI